MRTDMSPFLCKVCGERNFKYARPCKGRKKGIGLNCNRVTCSKECSRKLEKSWDLKEYRYARK